MVCILDWAAERNLNNTQQSTGDAVDLTSGYRSKILLRISA